MNHIKKTKKIMSDRKRKSVYVCVRACVRACACMRACVCARALVCVCECARARARRKSRGVITNLILVGTIILLVALVRHVFDRYLNSSSPTTGT